LPFLKRSARSAPDGSVTGLFYASDLHGSDRCWRKFLNAGSFYGVSHLVMGGDLTGKAIVPIAAAPDGGYSALFLGEVRHARTPAELEELMSAVRYNGMYPWVAPEAEIELHRGEDALRDDLFQRVMLDELQRWVVLADERSAEQKLDIYVIAGNDDPWSCEKVLESSQGLHHCEDQVVDLAGHEMVACSYANPTPWDSPRELPEDRLYEHLKKLAEQVARPQTAIFLFHVPPYSSGLDTAREINPDDLTVVMSHGQPREIPVGSHAVRQIIEEYQPMLSLHGHIHESRGITKIGRTVCVNAGSEYASGRIHGAVIKLSDSEVKQRQLVIG
jgi:uncharacterized protein